jgi:hypothetical protein
MNWPRRQTNEFHKLLIRAQLFPENFKKISYRKCPNASLDQALKIYERVPKKEVRANS